ncbi:MAG: hypothetical protein R2911_40970 [Caldilineaceae bacterium]
MIDLCGLHQIARVNAIELRRTPLRIRPNRTGRHRFAGDAPTAATPLKSAVCVAMRACRSVIGSKNESSVGEVVISKPAPVLTSSVISACVA